MSLVDVASSLEQERFNQLLEAFHKLPCKRTIRTFMQITRYPHYENVSSNILAFYFDPTEEHDMRDMLLRALLKCLNPSHNEAVYAATVEREVPTPGGGKLDLLVSTSDCIVGIENKIWANLYNDLRDYAELVSARAGDAPISTHRVALTVRRLDRAEQQRMATYAFVNITYGQLIHEARNLLGHYASKANAKFLTYFTDFMQTIEDLTGANQDEGRTAFFINHGAAIDALIDAYTRFSKERIRTLRGLIELKDSLYAEYIWQEQLVIDIMALGEHADKLISLSVEWDSSGWTVTIFSRLVKPDYCATPSSVSHFLECVHPFLHIEGYQLSENKEQVFCNYSPKATETEMANVVNDLIRRILNVLGRKDGVVS